MFGKGGTYMDEQKQELMELISDIKSTTIIFFLIDLIKIFRDRGEI